MICRSLVYYLNISYVFLSLLFTHLSLKKKKMSNFGRSGPPDINYTYSFLVLNITFRTSADDLFPLFEKYGKVVDVFIPRDRRTGDSRGFAFVWYKYADEAQKAVDKLDGRVVDGREIMVQFAKYGPNAEKIFGVRRIFGVGETRSPLGAGMGMVVGSPSGIEAGAGEIFPIGDHGQGVRSPPRCHS